MEVSTMRIKISSRRVWSFVLMLGIAVALLATGYSATASPVVVWTTCAASGVLSNVLDVLKGAEIDFVQTETREAAKLEAALQAAQVFLIPDSPKCTPRDIIELGKAWATVLKRFVEGGGKIVGMVGSVKPFGEGPVDDLLRAAGLTEAVTEDFVDLPAILEVVREDHPLVQGVPKTFPAEESTVFFEETSMDKEMVDGGEVIVRVQGSNRVVVFAKTIGVGSLVLLGFDLQEPSEPLTANPLATILVNAVRVVGCGESIRLESNIPKADQEIGAGPIVLTEPKSQYCIEVPVGAKLLAIKLDSQAEKGNVDMHVRHGQPVKRPGKIIEADFALVSDGNEFIVINNPKPGTYFIAVSNPTLAAQKFTIIATPVADIVALKAGKPVDGQIDPNAGLLPFLRQYLETRGGLLGLTQYKFVVPKGARSVTIQLLGPRDKNLDLHLRYGKPVEIRPDGGLEVDLSVTSPVGEEAVVISGAFLKPESLYIAVESLEKEKQSFKILVTVDTGGGLQTFIF